MNPKVKLPISERKDKILAIKITSTEQKKIKEFCLKNSIKQTDLVRFALRTILPQF